MFEVMVIENNQVQSAMNPKPLAIWTAVFDTYFEAETYRIEVEAQNIGFNRKHEGALTWSVMIIDYTRLSAVNDLVLTLAPVSICEFNA